MALRPDALVVLTQLAVMAVGLPLQYATPCDAQSTHDRVDESYKELRTAVALARTSHAQHGFCCSVFYFSIAVVEKKEESCLSVFVVVASDISFLTWKFTRSQLPKSAGHPLSSLCVPC